MRNFIGYWKMKTLQWVKIPIHMTGNGFILVFELLLLLRLVWPRPHPDIR